nr:hypothetical protein [Mycoplasmopsis bovis]
MYKDLSLGMDVFTHYMIIMMLEIEDNCLTFIKNIYANYTKNKIVNISEMISLHNSMFINYLSLIIATIMLRYNLYND